MSWSYDWTAAPNVAQVRLMVADTDPADPIFSDEEINGALEFESAQGSGLYVSSMFMATGMRQPVTTQQYSIRRAAALLLDALAANKSRLGSIKRLLDVELDPGKAAIALRETAKTLRETEANSGSFAIVEQVNDQFGARERVWRQFLRLYGG